MSTLVEIRKALLGWGPADLPPGMHRGSDGAYAGPHRAPYLDRLKDPKLEGWEHTTVKRPGPGPIPSDWVRPESGREGTKTARKAKIIRGAKIGGGAAAATAGVGAAALAASRALRKPVAQTAATLNPKTLAAVSGGGVVAGTGGGLVMRKRKKEQS